jgi:hypothetical protein
LTPVAVRGALSQAVLHWASQEAHQGNVKTESVCYLHLNALPTIDAVKFDLSLKIEKLKYGQYGRNQELIVIPCTGNIFFFQMVYFFSFAQLSP